MTSRRLAVGLFLTFTMTSFAQGPRTDCNTNGIPDGIEIGPLDGHALLFNGVDDYVDLGPPATTLALTELGQGDFTLETWVRTTDTGRSVMIGNYSYNGMPNWNFMLHDSAPAGRVRIAIGDGESWSDCFSTVSVADGFWHHVAAVRRVGPTGGYEIYIDGVLDAEVEVATVPFTSSNRTMIGRDPRDGSHYVDGPLDELRVWNVARTGAEIAGSMYNVLNGDEPGLVAYWRFDEGTDSTATDLAGGLVGDLMGPPAWVAIGDDCNDNDVLDECDIADGVSEDCDGNGVPDECENLPTGVLYVDDDATGGLNDGSSWDDAFVDLADAIVYAGCPGVAEIRIAGGTYKPGTAREDTFRLANGVAIRGGYRGLAAGGDSDDRDIVAFTTILNGDLNGDDQPGWVNRGDNSLNVVIGSDVNASAELDGVVIAGGYDDGSSGCGGGMYVHGGSPTLINCTFDGNWAAEYGGGIGVQGGSPELIDCTFILNGSLGHGGGMSNQDGGPTLTDCVFNGNRGNVCGSGMYNQNGNPILTNCTFIGNIVLGGGGGMGNHNSDPTLTGCTFSGNLALNCGGGMFSQDSNATIAGCTFSHNAANVEGGGMYSTGIGGPTLVNCVMWDNSPDPPIWDDGAAATTAAYSCIRGGWEGEGNIDADPLFVDADGPDGAHGTVDDDVRLRDGSPCINRGNNYLVPAGVTADFEGEARIQACRVDMGADETPFVGDIIDCNDNGVPDECDIEEGVSGDCNQNTIPDDCEIADCDGSLWCRDCNDNGVLDSCDIADGTSPDVSPADGIPDDCQGVPPVTGACCLSCACIVATESACLAAGGEYQGDGTTCDGVECPTFDPADLDNDGDVDLDDFNLFQQQFTGPWL